MRRPPQRLDLGAHLLGRSGVAPVDDDVGARLRQRPGERPPEAARRAVTNAVRPASEKVSRTVMVISSLGTAEA